VSFVIIGELARARGVLPMAIARWRQGRIGRVLTFRGVGFPDLIDRRR
jgi:hypothetical protein